MRTILAAVICLWAIPASAQIFECDDADGAKTFTQKCPAGTVKQRQLNIDTTQPANAPPQTSISDEEAAFRARQIEREKAEAKEKQDRDKKAEESRRCPSVQQWLETLESGRRIRTSEGIMDDQQRAAAIQKQRDFVDKWCN